jgi:hypothetical protein
MSLSPRRCEECDRLRTDVQRMHDPFHAQAADPGEEPWMRNLCEACAEQRFLDG